MKKLKLEKTKKGLPAIWEKGGGMTNTGFAQIVANPDGSPKHPVYIRRGGTLANAEHALFIAQPGDIVIQAEHHRGDFKVKVWRIDQILEEEARLNLLHEFSLGEWDIGLSASLEAACIAAMQKASCYHCRAPHYIES